MLTYHIEANTLDQLRKMAIADLHISAIMLDPQLSLPLAPTTGLSHLEGEPVKVLADTGTAPKRPGRPRKAENNETAPAVAPAPQADNAAPQVQVGNSASAPTESSPAVEGATGTGSDNVADEATTSEPVAPTFEAMKDALMELNAKKGISAPGEILARFGFQKIRQVTPEKFGDVITAAQQALAS